ncbi:hypothetical protein EJ05DRAFT_479079 [Pseudovirgaria hyperparasitica]|uniref:Inner kinetochore subunit AME1 domain-containing protein n=1 Tax=Pseudovirgaria hyperparasitica TaxID=470096 RepID=A0A6A6VX96_9PEZI|nr:uncharacterized protein EJ05DRAFT_479079 [Pseudovirgaria hyperparasitica]KAF2755288.1 hypothetical protein EJ05DRAFT_479079 [Pseudovirgaria hyperparasitica]
MAPNDRAERRQMRQRGAGVTNVQNINFGFKIGGGALQPRRSGRPSPLPAQRSARSTPNRLPPQLSGRSRQTSTPAQTSHQAHHTGSRSSKTSAAAKKTPKQPSLGNKAPHSQQQFTTPTVIGKRKRPQSATVQEDSEHDELEADDPAHRTSTGRSHVSILPSITERPPEPADDAEDDLAEANNGPGASSVHSNRMGVAAAQRRRSQGRQSYGSLNLRAKGRTPKRRESVATWLIDQSRLTPVPPAVPPSVLKSRTSLRTPIVRKSLGRPKTSTSTGKQPKRTSAAATVEAEEEQGDEGGEELDEDHQEGEEVVDELSTELSNRSVRKSHKSQQKTRKEIPTEEDEESEDELSPEARRPKSGRDPRFQVESGDEASDYEGEQSVRSELRVPVREKRLTKAARPRQKQKAKAHSGETEEPGARQKKAKGETVPITVYRLANASQLGGQGEDDGDPLQNPNLASISGVNAVDVLFQITSELADRQQNSITRHLQLSTDERQRSELKRKRTMLDMFKAQLSDRLFELTDAINTGTVLRKRLKAALKKRVALTDELLSVRKQREDRQLAMDATRDRHEASVHVYEKQSSLNSALHDIELAVSRGRLAAKDQGREAEGPRIPLEMLLRTVAGQVSSRVPGGGVTDRAKALNVVLEDTAKVLEGRRR